MRFNSIHGLAALAAATAMGCGSHGDGAAVDAGADGPPLSEVLASDVPVNGLSPTDVASFENGDALFDLPFREADGLGPLYVRQACGQCHNSGGRGPGLVQKMAVVEADGVTHAADQSALMWGVSEKTGLAAGAVTPILPPPGNPNILVTIRLGPPVLGRGYLEAIDEAVIEAQVTTQAARTDAIHGVINRVTYTSVPDPADTFFPYTQGQTGLVGRFGVKSRIATINDFVADAFQGDMGLTTPMRPVELPNPDGLTDDDKPGVDLAIDHVERIAFYVRRIAIPLRTGLTTEGATLFDQVQCSACHVPTMHTRADYPIPQMADIDAPVYTDMLLHDMGNALADGQTDGTADSFAYRTAPLIGLRFAHSYLHDGRAPNVAAAIAAHDGEAQASAAAFAALSPADQATLLAYVQAL